MLYQGNLVGKAPLSVIMYALCWNPNYAAICVGIPIRLQSVLESQLGCNLCCHWLLSVIHFEVVGYLKEKSKELPKTCLYIKCCFINGV